MAAEYDGPIFDAIFTEGHAGGVVVPDRYLEVPQGRIMDMLPAQPGMAEHHAAVVRDRASGHRFIYTFSPQAKNITPSAIEQKPFIGKLVAHIGTTSITGYVLDYRRVQNLMYPVHEYTYDPGVGEQDQEYQILQAYHGIEPAKAVIVRYHGNVDYMGERVFVDHARVFCESVDSAIENGFKKSPVMESPAYSDAGFSYHDESDLEASNTTHWRGDTRSKFQ